MTPTERAALEKFQSAFMSSPERLSRLAPGATDDAISAFRDEIGVELPPVWIELYRWRDGTRLTRVDPKTLELTLGGRLCGHEWLSLDRVLATKRSWMAIAEQYRLTPEDHPDYACRHEAWIPLMGIDYADLAWSPVPCFGGPAGQRVGFDFKGGTHWTVDHLSIADWLVTWAELAACDLLDADRSDERVDAIFERFNPQRRTIDFPNPPTKDQFD
jgi:cell wall assembly regulator SMI1